MWKVAIGIVVLTPTKLAAYRTSVRGAGMEARPQRLTAIQRRVLALVAEGCGDKEIAAVMAISQAGARKHVETLRRLYRAGNRAALVRAAFEAGDLPG